MPQFTDAHTHNSTVIRYVGQLQMIFTLSILRKIIIQFHKRQFDMTFSCINTHMQYQVKSRVIVIRNAICSVRGTFFLQARGKIVTYSMLFANKDHCGIWTPYSDLDIG